MAPIETAAAPASLMNCRRFSVEICKPALALFSFFDITIPPHASMFVFRPQPFNRRALACQSIHAFRRLVVVHFQSAMSLNLEKDSSLPLGMTTKVSICHLEPFGTD